MGLFDKVSDPKAGYFSILRSNPELMPRAMLHGPIGPHMQLQGNPVITWCFNNYLGFANHPANRAVEKASVAANSTSIPMGSRFIAGNCERHNELEALIAQFIGFEASTLFLSAYLGAIGSITALVGREDTILLDAEAHACLYDAAHQCVGHGAIMRTFKHNDINSLENQLRIAYQHSTKGVLVVVDGVYSMSGDLAPLDDIVSLKSKYPFHLLVDDCHGTLVTGLQGKGTPSLFQHHDQVDLLLTSFAKSFGSMGGIIAGKRDVISYIEHNARTNIFSHALPRVFVDKTLSSFELFHAHPDLHQALMDNTDYMHRQLYQAGLDYGESQTPITPLFIECSDEATGTQRATEVLYRLRHDFGIFVTPVTFPAIPRNRFLIRFVITALHSKHDIDHTVEALNKMPYLRRLNA